ncbi:MAG TPA: hypothetical protein PK074_12235, partial [Spirochaetales bacterium]|nr:hypothetical protein [Spirochaetales bacterium]
ITGRSEIGQLPLTVQVLLMVPGVSLYYGAVGNWSASVDCTSASFGTRCASLLPLESPHRS